MSEKALRESAEHVIEQLMRHVDVCLADPADAAVIVNQGEALRRSVLAFEKTLGDVTGWSNPLRYLDDEGEDKEDGARISLTNADSRWRGENVAQVHVDARYYLRIENPDAVRSYADTRFGDESAGVTDAVRKVYEADAWKPGDYPDGLIHVDDVGIDVYIEGE